ncbi:MAG: DnaJ domain-containing protein [Desulfobacteraceae bacterium]|nr:DnaJ domain-containing protein [Desulfobacteraceae bacterium]
MFEKLSAAESNLTQEEKPMPDQTRQRDRNPLRFDENASKSEIRAAYLEAIKKYHPDRYMEFPPEFRQLAEEKTKEINSAYSRLLNIR